MSVIKNAGFFSYKDPYGWMDSMKGPRWNNAVQKQKDIYSKFLKDHINPKEVEIVQHEMVDEKDHVDPIYIYGFRIEMKGANRFVFRYEDLPGETTCADLDVADGGNIWFVQDKSHGAEEYNLIHQNGVDTRWTYKKKVAPYVAFLSSKVYVLEEETDLWYNKLVCLDADTGGQRKVLLELKDPEWNLELIKGSNQCLFLRGNNAGQQRLWYLSRQGNLQEITGSLTAFVPVGYRDYRSKEPCYFGLKNQSYHPFGFPKQFKFPKGFIPETVFFGSGDLVLRSYGKRIIWNMISGKIMLTVIANIDPNPILYWRFGIGKNTVLSRFEFDRRMFFDPRDFPSFAAVHNMMAVSKDGTKIPCVVVRHHDIQSVKLLCIGYGAYGMQTRIDSTRWKPYLRRGWALCFAFIRGGGDHNDAWAEAARAAYKYKSMEDFEACIHLAQKETNIAPSKTVIYGRSAGGYLVGACLARNPTGKLFKGVYTEVPYVDVLSTTLNTHLPLTKLEFNEFGNPRERIEDAQTLLHLSPIHALPPERAPQVFVLCRIGLKDKEVFAYESMKWISTLQERTKAPKLLAITDDEGHFTSEQKKFRERAEDFCILESLIVSN